MLHTVKIVKDEIIKLRITNIFIYIMISETLYKKTFLYNNVIHTFVPSFLYLQQLKSLRMIIIQNTYNEQNHSRNSHFC